MNIIKRFFKSCVDSFEEFSRSQALWGEDGYIYEREAPTTPAPTSRGNGNGNEMFKLVNSKMQHGLEQSLLAERYGEGSEINMQIKRVNPSLKNIKFVSTPMDEKESTYFSDKCHEADVAHGDVSAWLED